MNERQYFEVTGEIRNNRVIGAYLYLLIVGSLMGFVSFNFLLGHVSAAKVGTYATPEAIPYIGMANPAGA